VQVGGGGVLVGGGGRRLVGVVEVGTELVDAVPQLGVGGP